MDALLNSAYWFRSIVLMLSLLSPFSLADKVSVVFVIYKTE
jgi:hypothetical protein